MLFLAGIAVTFIGPKLKREIKGVVTPTDDVYDPATLSDFNGRDGRLAYIAFEGDVYDVTELGKWKGGKHFRHLTGEDQTQAISTAPHGVEMLERAKVVGSFDPKKQPALTGPHKLFM